MKRRAWFLLISLSLAAIGFAYASITTPSPPIPTLPPVQATAPTQQGGNVLCYGGGCALMLDMMQSQINQEFFTHGFPLEDDPPVSKAQFCSNLKAQRPPNCPNLYPDSTPGVPTPGKSAYAFNQCGPNRLTMWLGDKFLSYIATNTYSGDFNAPAAGVSFLGACQSHDQCWAGGESKASCNLDFVNSMTSACNGLGSASAIDSCRGYAGLYHFAVTSTDKSQEVYNSQLQKRECSIWAQDMRTNNCAN